MTRDESLEITQMVLVTWHGRDWTKEEIDAFARGIQHLDAEIAVSAVARASREVKYRPSIAELHEVYRAERRRLRAEVVPPPEEPKQIKLEFWIKRWMCARFLYPTFGKEQDLRRFPQQLDFGDLTYELMPEGAWVTEANAMDDEEFLAKWRKTIRS